MNRIKAYILILVTSLAINYCATAQEQDEMNILFIGNSFTARHDLSQLVKKVFEEGNPDLKVNVDQMIYGGQSLFQHTKYYYSHTFIEQASIDDSIIDARIKRMEDFLALEEVPDEYIHFWQDIRNTTNVPDFPKDYIKIAIQRHQNLKNNNPRIKWDYVVLQSWMDEVNNINDGYAKYARQLSNIAKEQGAEVVLYITAPDIQNQAPVSEPVKQDDVDREINYVLDLAREIQPFAVVHVPLAINMIQEGGTELTFRYVNDFHPNQRTAFLTANMFYAAFFNKSTEGFDFNAVTENNPKGMAQGQDPDGNPATVVFEEDEKIYLQKMAFDAVTKFRQFWKGDVAVSGISIRNVPSGEINLGSEYQLKTEIQPMYASNKNVVWELISGDAVTINENGLIEAIEEGTAKIKVTTVDGGFADSCEVIVKKKVISVYGVLIGNCPNFILQAGETHQLIANVAPLDADDRSVIWKSSDPEVAMVNDSGLVSALNQGSVKIMVTTNDGGYTNSCQIGVMGTTTATKKIDNDNVIRIFPNPVSELLYLEFSNTDEFREVRIYNSSGQLIYCENARGFKEQIDMKSLETTGLLVVQIKSNQGSYVQKVLIP